MQQLTQHLVATRRSSNEQQHFCHGSKKGTPHPRHYEPMIVLKFRRFLPSKIDSGRHVVNSLNGVLWLSSAVLLDGNRSLHSAASGISRHEKEGGKRVYIWSSQELPFHTAWKGNKSLRHHINVGVSSIWSVLYHCVLVAWEWLSDDRSVWGNRHLLLGNEDMKIPKGSQTTVGPWSGRHMHVVGHSCFAAYAGWPRIKDFLGMPQRPILFR